MSEPSTPLTPGNQARLLKIATYASVGTALLLVGAKGAAWFLTGSVSVLASLVDSSMDVAASFINLLAVRYALAPADSQHRFGHGKAESLAAVAQATFIAGSAVFLFIQAIDRLLHPATLSQVDTGIVVMVFAMVVTTALVALQRYVIKKTGSTAIRADSLHFVTDFLSNGATLLALLLVGAGWSQADPWLAILISMYILYSAKKIGVDAFHLLMDHELPEAKRLQIKQIALSVPGVRGIHDLRTRQSGQIPMIQLHIELDDNMLLYESHAIADHIEVAIANAFGQADVIIHEDPVSVGQAEHAETKAYLPRRH